MDKEIPVPQPTVIIRGRLAAIKDCYLVVEKTILCKVESTNALLVLLAAFYVFNMHYTPGFSNLPTFLEVFLLDTKVPRKTRLGQFLSQMRAVSI